MLYTATLVMVLVMHWLADFVFQTDAMAKGKSKSNRVLTSHVLTYTMIGLILVAPAMLVMTVLGLKHEARLYMAALPMVWLLNAPFHWVTDYYTSRWSGRLWAQGRVHDFFVVIGLDQLIHQLTLVGLLALSLRLLGAL